MEYGAKTIDAGICAGHSLGPALRPDIPLVGGDHLIRWETAEAFADAFCCGLTVLEDGEHWFYTPTQLAFLDSWTGACLKEP